jgi:hypothetical protein
MTGIAKGRRQKAEGRRQKAEGLITGTWSFGPLKKVVTFYGDSYIF